MTAVIVVSAQTMDLEEKGGNSPALVDTDITHRGASVTSGLPSMPEAVMDPPRVALDTDLPALWVDLHLVAMSRRKRRKVRDSVLPYSRGIQGLADKRGHEGLISLARRADT